MDPRRILQSALVLLLVALPVACGGDDEADGSTTTAPAASTTTTAAEDDEADGPSTTAAPAEQMSVWPLADSSVTYDDPIDAATEFATELVGFTDPVVGEFQQGDSRSGEVEVRPSADGPVTTVMVRQLDRRRQLGRSWPLPRPTSSRAGRRRATPSRRRCSSRARAPRSRAPCR